MLGQLCATLQLCNSIYFVYISIYFGYVFTLYTIYFVYSIYCVYILAHSDFGTVAKRAFIPRDVAVCFALLTVV